MASSLELSRLPGPSPLKDQAYRAIKDAILTLKLKPGQALVESEVAQQLGVSKTPVRDALLELEREGLVTKILFKGTYVSEVTPRDVREIFELRAVLEGLAARRAAPFFREEELERARELLTAQHEALTKGSIELASQLGKRFHDMIIQKADNRRLIPILRNLDDHLQRVRLLSDQINGRLNKSVEEHRRILLALREKDPELAEKMVRAHLESVLADLSSEWPRGAAVDES